MALGKTRVALLKMMRVSKRGLVELASHEGVVPMPYKDSVGVWTFGVGHTRYAGDPNPASLPKGKEQPLSYVFEVFEKDVEKYARDVRRAVKVPLKQHEFDALVSFHYNTGAIARASLTRYLNAGNKSAAARAFMNWTKPKEITARRQKERDLFEKGKYGDGNVTVWKASSSGRVLWGTGRRVNMWDYMDGAPADPIEEPPAYLEKGAKGVEVTKLQNFLNAWGAKLVADGDFGPATEAAVIEFQLRHSDPLGKVGDKTWTWLKAERV